MPTTDRTRPNAAPRAATAAAPSSSASTASNVLAATPGADGCPRCGAATINCHGRLDCPDCTWTEARSTR